VIQGAALAFSAARIPFFASKSFPQPAEVLALGVMLFVQITASALLFPFLMRDLRAAAMVIATTAPFTVLAGFLTGTIDLVLQAYTAAFVLAWLLGLALWRVALRSDRARAVGITVALLVALGGPIAWYLCGEYVFQSSAVNWRNPDAGGPFFAALAVSTQGLAARSSWMLIATHVGISVFAALTSILALRLLRSPTSAPIEGSVSL
jgi:hypothetical protein